MVVGAGIAVAGLAYALTRGGAVGERPRDAQAVALREDGGPAVDASVPVAVPAADAAVRDALPPVDATVVHADAKAAPRPAVPTPTDSYNVYRDPGPFYCAEVAGFRDPWVCWERAGLCEGGTDGHVTKHHCRGQASAYCGESFVGHTCLPTEELCRRYLIPPAGKEGSDLCHLVTSWP